MGIRNWLDYILVFIFGCILIGSILFFNVSNDFITHKELLISCIDAGTFPVPPLYYSLLFLFSFGLLSGETIFLAMVFLIGSAITLKYIATKNFLKSYIIKNVSLDTGKNSKLHILLLSVSLIVMTPIIVGHNFYLGKIGINVWHNSTLMTEFPFAILLFTFSYNYLVHKDNRAILYILIFQVIGILIKPSYYLTFIPVFSLLILINRPLLNFRIVACLLIGFIFFLIEYYFIYQNDLMDNAIYKGMESKIGIAPFKVWSAYSDSILLDFLSSITYPSLFIILYFKQVKLDIGLKFVWGSFIVGLALAILLIENGPRAYHANFFWSVIIANYLLFMYSAAMNFKIIYQRGSFSIKDKSLLFLLVLHFISGIIYIISLFLNKTF